ncbi:MAG: polysaccharide ABC transporter ATP-binding protein [Elainella sp. Prado103]|nr:polysaccharide ABC transporter ATP-binding protein [Elainella sp. Prado103]
MFDTVIRVENLGKKYVIAHQRNERYATLRDSLIKTTRNILKPHQRPKSRISSSTHEEFWALKDVSFEVRQGDRVGIIGRNGAGKSTLLKILSRITEPTKGRIQIKGRIASLLEVGTGFHPELTGRENIFLNGAILGMSKVEIKRKFDEIVAFAEIEKFLDTPVKRYSSGMYVRLAFSVAAHLEPEILIVDEVLAVGDAQFQKKCLGKMESVGREGRTILFVSHNMSVVEQLCSKAVLLQQGELRANGSALDILKLYMSESSSFKKSMQELRSFSEMHQMGLACPVIQLKENAGQLDLEASIIVESMHPQGGVGVAITISTQYGSRIASIGPRLHRKMLPPFKGKQAYSFHFPAIDQVLAGGDYLVSFALLRPKVDRIAFLEYAGEFHLPAKIIYPNGVPCSYEDFGTVVLRPQIQIEAI